MALYLPLGVTGVRGQGQAVDIGELSRTLEQLDLALTSEDVCIMLWGLCST